MNIIEMLEGYIEMQKKIETLNKKQEKLVSVIVPCYNVEKYVAECVNSIINQTYRNLEIILLNDCSTDHTLEALRSLKETDERIQMVDLKQNQGLSAVRNMGIEMANGEYISFVDSDDILSSNFYEMMVSKIETDDEIDIVVCPLMYFPLIDLLDNPKKKVLSIEENNFVTEFEYEKAELIKRDGVTFVVQMNKLFKRAIFDDLRFPEGRVHEDLYLIFDEYKKAKKVAFINGATYYYRQNREGSITNEISAKRINDMVFAYDHLCDCALDDGNANFYKWARHKQLEDFMYMSFKCNEENEREEEYIKRILERDREIFSFVEKCKFRLFLLSPSLAEKMIEIKKW